MGHLDEAKPGLESSLQLVEAILDQKPGDQKRQRQALERKQRLAWLDAMSGRIDLAWAASNAIAEEWQALLPESGSNVLAMRAYSIYLLNRAWLAQAMGKPEIAEQLLRDSMAILDTLMRKLPENMIYQFQDPKILHYLAC